jgi:DNA-binding beta-propeller fold protein YncE
MVKTAALAIMFSTLIATVLTSTASAGDIEQPIALDALPSVGLIVLGNRGTVYHLQGTAGQYRMAGSFHIPVNEYPVDLTLAQISREFYIFVTSNMTSSSSGGRAGAGRVTQYTLEGRVVNYWDVWGVCAGIDFDGATHTVYFAKSDRQEIVTIKFSAGGKSEVSSVGEIPQGTQIGPLAFDASAAKVYVADVASGGIYVFDLATKRTNTFATRLGNVTALRFIPAKRQLIAADAQRRKIVAFDTNGKTKPSALPIAAPLRHPSGLAIVEGNLLAVCDSDSGRIFFVTDNGQVVGQF